jgi:chromate transporter
VKFGALPDVAHILHGIKPVIIAVVVQAIWGLARTAVKSRWLAAVGIAALAMGFLGVNELILLAAAGAAAALIHRALASSGGHGPAGFAAWCWPLQAQSNHPMTKAATATATATGVVAAAGAVSLGLWPVFWFFLKVGSVLYGSGYVLLAFLRADLVERWGWLSEAQLLDAIAVGQVTPGPVFTTATFIGYLLQGTPGALVATAGIFLPAFFFVAVSGPIIPRVRASPSAGAFLDGVNVASLALMTVVTWRLGQGALTDALGVGLAAVSAVLLLRYRVNSVWLILAGAAVGWLTGWWH